MRTFIDEFSNNPAGMLLTIFALSAMVILIADFIGRGIQALTAPDPNDRDEHAKFTEGE